MPRARSVKSAREKHKKVIKQAKGYWGSRSRLFRRAQEAVLRAGEHSFAGRKLRKRDMRKLWITRISGALTDYDINYSRFIKGLKDNNIELNRKMLSEVAINDPEGFETVVKMVSKK